MTGPEHYRQAERLSSSAERVNDPDAALVMAQLATAHATLALAAATALVDRARSAPRASVPDMKAWAAAAASPTDPLDEIA